jgi:lysozyme family protein
MKVFMPKSFPGYASMGDIMPDDTQTTTKSVFEQCFDIVVGEEGGFDNNPADPGNWTGGKVNVGHLNGTKYGISAAAYPDLYIQALTLENAKDIYHKSYWAVNLCDTMPPSIAMLVFDAAVNNGNRRAIWWLQGAVGAFQDGEIGPKTIAALNRKGAQAVAIEFMAQRTNFMASFPTWPTFGLGWARRLAALPYHSLHITKGTT